MKERAGLNPHERGLRRRSQRVAGAGAKESSPRSFQIGNGCHKGAARGSKFAGQWTSIQPNEILSTAVCLLTTTPLARHNCIEFAMAILRPSERVTKTSAHGLAAKQSSEGKSTKESPARKVVKHPAYRLQAVSGASSRMIHANAPDGSCSARTNRLGRSKGVQD